MINAASMIFTRAESGMNIAPAYTKALKIFELRAPGLKTPNAETNTATPHTQDFMSNLNGGGSGYRNWPTKRSK